MANINGTSDSDTLFGTNKKDVIDGLAGADIIGGRRGGDTIDGGSGADIIAGGGGRDTIDGGSDADILTGGGGKDTFVISDPIGGPDTITDYTLGDDTLDLALLAGLGITAANITEYVQIRFLDGNVVISVDLDGAAGEENLIDVAVLSDYGETKVTVSIGADTFDVAVGGTIRGTNKNDIIVGSSQSNNIDGRDGNDVIYGYGDGSGRKGNAPVIDDEGGGADDHDLLIGGSGKDTIYAGGGDDTLVGGKGSDILYGDDGNDTIAGGGGGDTIDGGSGADILTGGGGKDTFVISDPIGGPDTITDYTLGDDTLDLALLAGLGITAANITEYVQIRFLDGNVVISVDLDGAAGEENLIDVAVLSDYGETKVTVSIGADTFDVAVGGTIRGTNKNDIIVGSSQSNNIDGRDGNDVIYGYGDGSGRKGNAPVIDDEGGGADDHDLLIGGSGKDTIYAGGGDDTLVGGGGGDTIDGGSGADIIKGGGGGDTIDGGSGADIIDGGGGGDTIDGGSGADIIAGGGGKDTFVISNAAGGPDTITDYAKVDDVIELQLLEGLGVTNLNIDDFVRVLRVGNDTQISVDVDGAATTNGFADVAFLPDHSGNKIQFAIGVELFTLPVVTVNAPPTANDDAATTDEDNPVIIPAAAMLENDTDPDASDILTVQSIDTAGTTGLVTDNGNGTFTYDPNGQFESLAVGESTTDNFSYTVSDGNGGTDTATVNITISGVNDAPVADDESYGVSEDSLLSIGVPGVLGGDTDVDASDVLTVTAFDATSALGATVTVNSNGSFSYDPRSAGTLQALGSGQNVVDSFTYTADDGNGGTDTATVEITVLGRDEGGSSGGGGGEIVAPDVPASADLDYYAKFGEGQWLQLDGFSLGFDQSVVDDGSKSGGSGGKSTADEAVIYLGDSVELTSLSGSLLSGEHIDEVQLVAVARGEDFPMPVDAYAFGNVILTGLDASSDSEALSFNFASFSHEHQDRSTDKGGAIAPVEVGWDFATNQSGGPGPDLTNPSELGFVPGDPGSELTHYVRLGEADWLQLDSFDFNLARAVSLDSGTGGKELANLDASAVALSLGSSGVLTQASLGLFDGKALQDVEIETYRSSEKGQQLVDEFHFDNVVLTSLDTDNAAQALSFVYSKFSHGHIDYAGDGKSESTSVGWDLATNTDPGAPAPDPDANASEIAPDVPASADLDYYAKFGEGQWLQLDGFSLGFDQSVVDDGSKSGGSGGKSTADEAVIYLGDSVELTSLSGSLLSGEHIDEVQLVAVARGEDFPMPVDAYAFGNVILTGLDASSDSEALSFNFASFSHEHQDRSTDKGGAIAPVEVGWDFATNQSGGPGPDLTNPSELGFVPGDPGSELTHYVRLGEADWLRLDSFDFNLARAVSLDSGTGGKELANLDASAVALSLGSSGVLTQASLGLFDGKALQDVEIETYRSSEKGQQLVDEFHFDNVVLTSLDTDNAAQALSFVYSKFSHGHIDYAGDGKSESTSVGWDLATNTDPGAPAPDPDANASEIAPDVPASADLDYYAKFGEGQWLQLDGFSLGFDQSVVDDGSKSGGSGGKSTADEAVIYLGDSVELTSLSGSLLSGEHIDEVQLVAVARGEDFPMPVDAYAFGNVILTGLDASSDSEALSFNFASFSHEHQDRSTDKGGAIAPVEVGWDFATNQSGGPGPDLTNPSELGFVPGDPGSELTHYVRLGEADWLRLDSFDFNLARAVSLDSGTGGKELANLDASAVALSLGSSGVLTQASLGLFDGKALQDVEIETYRSSEKGQQLVDEFHFDNVVLTSLDTDNAAQALSFVYSKFSHGHIDYTGDGKSESTSVGWDLATNTDPGALPAPDPDVKDGDISPDPGANDTPDAVDDLAATDEDNTTLVAATDLLLNDSDPDTSDTLSVASIDTTASTGLVTDNGNDTFTYDPNGQFESLAVGDSTTDSFSYTVSDGNGGTDTATVTITINGVNDAPTANDDAATTDEDNPVIIPAAALLTNDTDPDASDILTVQSIDTAGTTGLVTDNGNGTFTYDPNGQFESLAVGEEESDSFSYTVSDGNGGTDTATVTITINGVNDAPTANDDAATTDEDNPVIIPAAAMLENDTDPDASDILTVQSIDTAGTTGLVTDNGNGTFTYDPNGQFESLAVGESTTDNFSYTVSDGNGGTDTATVNITISGVNDAPVADDESYGVSEDSLLSIGVPGVLGGDTDVDASDVLTVTAFDATSALGATVTVNSNGSFSYDPRSAGTLQALGSGQNVVDSFTYTADDGNGGTDTATVEITVLGRDEGGSSGGGGGEIVAPDVPASADLDYYAKFGEGQWLQLDGFSLGFDQSVVDDGSKSGGSGGKSTADEAVIYLGDSVELTSLSGSLLSGEHIDEVQLVAVARGEDFPMPVDAYAFGNVILTGLDASSDSEALSFNFASFSHEHQDRSTDKGGAIAPVEVGWDFATNQSGGPGPDLTNPSELGFVPGDPGSELTHYVRLGEADWLQLDSFDFNLARAVSLDSGTGGKELANLDASAVALSLGSSGVLTQASLGLFDGKALQDVEIETYRSSEKGQQLVDEFHFDNVVLTSLDTDNAAQALSFVYSKFSHGHIDYAGDGKSESTSVGWDLATNTDPGAPAPDPDANASEIAPDVPASADLDYYAKFGEGEWLQLDGFSLGFDQSVVDDGSKSGGSGGKSTADEAVIYLGDSVELTSLSGSLLSGEHIDEVQLVAVARGEDFPMPVDAYAFGNVILTGLDASSDSEALSFNFASFSHEHQDRSTDKGGAIAPVEVGWDFATNQSGGPGPDLTNPSELGFVPGDPGSELTHYVRLGEADWLQLDSFDFNLARAVSLDSGTGGKELANLDASAVALSLGSSGVLTQASLGLFDGKALQDVEIETYRSSEKGQQLVDEFHFDNVVLTSLDTDNAAQALSFVYSKFSHGHIDYAGDGKSESTSVGWDLATNTDPGAPAPDPDANASEIAPDVPASADLDYYAKFGEGQWLQLDGFSLGFDQSVVDDGSKSGGSGGKSTADEAVIYLGDSVELTSLSGSLLSGEHIDEVQLVAVARGEDFPMPVDAYAFGNVILTGLDASSDSEALSFNFASFSHEHQDRSTDKGGAIAPVEVGWDFATNQSGGPGPDLTNPSELGFVPGDPGSELTHYVRLGEADWLRLDSFDFNLARAVSLDSGTGGKELANLDASAVALSLGSSGVLTQASLGLFDGKALQDVEIETYRSSEKGQQLVDEFHFDNVVLTSLDTDNAAQALSFVYSKFSHGHIDYTGDGKSESTSVGWDLATNTDPGALPAPDPDVFV